MILWWVVTAAVVCITEGLPAHLLRIQNDSRLKSTPFHIEKKTTEAKNFFVEDYRNRKGSSPPKFFSDNNNTSLRKALNRVRRQSQHNKRKGKYVRKERFDGDVFNALRSTGVMCMLCVVVDKEFIKAHGRGELKEVKINLEKLIDSVSWMWRSIDWNGDNFPDNIGFKILRFDEWDPYPGEGIDHYHTPQPAMSLLAELGVIDFGDCCLGLGFTMRPFTQHQVGVSLVASPMLIGGICDYRTSSPRFNSRNVILISGRGLKGYPLSSSDLEGVLLHELGHAFGVSKHDNEMVHRGLQETRECSGHSINHVRDLQYGPDYLLNVEPPGGRFIMWSNNQQGRQAVKWNNLQFSSCSKFEVAAMLEAKRGICFVEEIEPYCGNGILESSEDCDCGSEFNCRLMACCGSRRSSNPCRKISPDAYNGFLNSKPTTACRTKYAYPFSVAAGIMKKRAEEREYRKLKLQKNKASYCYYLPKSFLATLTLLHFVFCYPRS